MTSSALTIYQTFVSKFLSSHPKGNKLRDVPDEYVTNGHCFSLGKYEKELIYSFDICSGCESHHLLDQLEIEWKEINKLNENSNILEWISNVIEKTTSLTDWNENRNEIKYKYCPKRILNNEST